MRQAGRQAGRERETETDRQTGGVWRQREKERAREREGILLKRETVRLCTGIRRKRKVVCVLARRRRFLAPAAQKVLRAQERRHESVDAWDELEAAECARGSDRQAHLATIRKHSHSFATAFTLEPSTLHPQP